MYKYIIYCSISAVIIIVSKYVYQNWIKQKNKVLELQNNILLLKCKVDELEKQLENQKISGGVKIPIVFRSIEKKTPNKNIQFSPTSNTISLSNNIDQLSEDQSTESSKSKQESGLENVVVQTTKSSPKVSPKSSPKVSPKSSPKTTPNKILELEDINLDNISGISNIQKELDKSFDLPNPPSVQEESTKKSKKEKKPSMPDAKNYNNGDKIFFQEEEYICVVGKRGGHSWKKL